MSDLKTAIELLASLVDPHECQWASSRAFRADTETCAEYHTDMQGVPSLACSTCRAREFLAKFGYTPNKHGHWDYPKKTHDRTLTDDEIVEKLLTCFYLYDGYPVGSRGPAGQLMDVIKDLRPDVAEVIVEEDAHQAFQKFFGEDGA